MNEFSHLENNLCSGKGYFPHFILSVDKGEKNFYNVEAYTHDFHTPELIKFKVKKNKTEMEKFNIIKDVRDYELFIKRAFGE
jgi:hypothetical protein